MHVNKSEKLLMISRTNIDTTPQKKENHIYNASLLFRWDNKPEAQELMFTSMHDLVSLSQGSTMGFFCSLILYLIHSCLLVPLTGNINTAVFVLCVP